MGWLENKIESVDDPSAPTTPVRVLGTPFIPSATRWVLCMYSFELDVDATEDRSIKLLSDVDADPATERAEWKLVGATGDEKLVARAQLVYMCPPGHSVKLVAAGTGTSSITQQCEVAFT